MIKGDYVIFNAFQVEASKSTQPNLTDLYVQAGHRIRDAMPQVISIDNFLDQHSDDKQIELCGKLAIVRKILEAESRSHLFIDPSNIYNKMRFSDIEHTWVTNFWKLLTENCSQEALEGRFKSVAFIIFNYDRCIEHYLYYSLQNVYNMSPGDAASLVKCIEIYHPYGTVGSLPWLGQPNSIEYGATPNPHQLVNLAKQIKTFTEGTDEQSSDVLSIRSLTMTSSRILFLGFAFHKLNIDLLFSTPANQSAVRHIFATANGLSKSDISSIEVEIRNMGVSQANVLIRGDLKCSQIFQEYWRSLSFL